jgi:predicted GIY-YIG superfamily endonuclease
MYYVYILLSKKSKRLYAGSTNNIKRRLFEHNSNQGGIYSKKNAPFILIYYEAFFAKHDTTKQELFYKSGYGRKVFNDKIKDSLILLRA